MKGILGRKIGMTSVFAKNGKLIPVTVIEVEPNIVSQIKTKEKDGYEAIQLAAFEKREKLANKPEIGHLKKANTTPKRFLREIRGVDVANYSLGSEVKADIFAEGEMVDVTGTSKGKGFQGVIKRWNQSRGPMGHGSQYHRGVGSLGTLLPMRVIPGKKMPGHMGCEQVTIQNLEIVQIDLNNNVILIKGNVPGPKKSLVLIKSSVKNPEKINTPVELITYIDETVEQPVEETTEEPQEENVEEDTEVSASEVVEEPVVETTYVPEPVVVNDVNYTVAENLVEYAKQFVGYPYVYGGNSLTNGTDCSGFTKLIYAQYGIDLPRVAYDQSYVGVEVPISNIQIGDLVLSGYSGKTHHVAIYIGNGQIVHALNSNVGIVITDLYIMPITHVRRVL